MVDSGYHPLKHHPLRIVMVDSGKHHPLRIVHGGYHPIKHHPLRTVLGWLTVGIILLSIIL